MATTVNVLCPNGRRVNIKVTPATTLLRVLEQACEKQKFDPALHTLKHHKKILDLSTLFRYTNLPQNAKLEMVPTEKPRTESTEVTLAVQCEDGKRVQGKFNPSSTTLWGVLTKLGLCEFEGGRLEPVVAYTNNQICGEIALQKKTLRDLGLTSGRAVLRLLFRERRAQLSQVSQSTGALPSQEDTSEVMADTSIKTDDQPSVLESGTSVENQSKPTTSSASTDEPMEAQSAADIAEPDDEQPKSKLSPQPYVGPHASSNQSSISTNQTTASSSAGGATSDEDLPYFPAHPISYFQEEMESAAARQPLQRQPMGPRSIFDHQVSLYAISEDEPLSMPTLEPFQFPPVVAAMLQSRSIPRSPPKVYDEPCDREQVVFHLDTSLPSPSVEVPDEFFDVTVQDVQRIHEDHKKQLESFSDAPLMTQTMRMAQIEKKYLSYDKAIVRVHFPDQWVLQGCFRPRESLKALVRFIRDNLTDPQIKFHLYTTPPKEVLKSGRMTFIEAGFVPAAIVHVGVDSRDAPQPALSGDCLKQARSGLEAEIVVAKKREVKFDSPSSSSTSDQPRPKSQGSGSSKSKAAATGSSSGGVGAGEARKVPKWFKMGK